MAEIFWANATSDPKRNFKFLLLINSIPSWIIKKTSKPSFTVKEAVHKYIATTFYYPGSVEWEKMTCTLVDPIYPDASKTLQGILVASGYKFPTNPNMVTSISKAAAVAALGQVTIKQIDADGNDVEEWVLRNAWISSVKYGELEYGNDDLTEITLELRYDFAQINFGIGGQAIPPANV